MCRFVNPAPRQLSGCWVKVFSVLIFTLLLLLSNRPVYAESVSDTLENYVQDIKGDIPGSGTNEYADPTAQNKSDFDDIIDLIRAENFAQADTDADALGYSLITLTDTGNSKVYYILKEDDPTTTDGWGTYIFDLTSKKDILIESTHPVFDTHSWRIAINLFQDSNAKVFLMAGTHRNSNDAGDESDMAHTESSMFQYVHEKESTADTIALQVHSIGISFF